MLRVVFDTNVLVSSLIRAGKPRELWNKVLEGRVTLVISDQILTEFREVIVRPEFKNYLRRNRLAKFLRIMLQKASVIKVRIHFTHASEDPDDNMVLEAAYSAEVDYIVSGDKHLLSMKELRDQDRYR